MDILQSPLDQPRFSGRSAAASARRSTRKLLRVMRQTRAKFTFTRTICSNVSRRSPSPRGVSCYRTRTRGEKCWGTLRLSRVFTELLQPLLYRRCLLRRLQECHHQKTFRDGEEITSQNSAQGVCFGDRDTRPGMVGGEAVRGKRTLG